jgi:4-amino-4-deoxy-L-arabinose transferase-like glycosyltransferase
MRYPDRKLVIGLLLTLGLLLGAICFSVWKLPPVPVEQVAWSKQAQWIAAPTSSYRLYARRTLYIADAMQTAWLRVSADNDFALYVNGQAIAGELSTSQNSLGLAKKLSDSKQNLNDSLPYRFLPPEWMHYAASPDWKLTTYVDLTTHLRPGKNVIAVAVQKNLPKARLIIEGAIAPVQGEKIDLTTGVSDWKVFDKAENGQGLGWFELNYPDQAWPPPQVLGTPKVATYSRLSSNLFERSLQGSWITGVQGSQGDIWLRKDWVIPKEQQRAYIRLSSTDKHTLLINGQLVKHFELENEAQLLLYDVTDLLHSGTNTLTIHLLPPLLNPSGKILSFFLDGWVETEERITAEIATDDTWISFPTETVWDQKAVGQSARLLQPPQPETFKRQYEGDAALLNYPIYLRDLLLYGMGGILVAFTLAWGIGRFWLGQKDSSWSSLRVGASLLMPAALVLIGFNLLKHRFAEVERGLFFAQSQSNTLILLSFIVVVLLTLLISQSRAKALRMSSAVIQSIPKWLIWLLLSIASSIALSLALDFFFGFPLMVIGLLLGNIMSVSLLFRSTYTARINDSFKTLKLIFLKWEWVCLAGIITVGFILRVYQLTPLSFEADEMTSLDTARSILHTGIPQAASGIWYTRGPLYHYMLGLWLGLVGEAATNGRLLSALWGTATLLLIFLLTHKVTGKVGLALLVTAILAIDPIVLWYSRFIRFYQLLQFMSLFSIWAFIKGFMEQKRKSYQIIFFLALTSMLLIQELTIVMLPCFLLVALYCYRPFRLKDDWIVVIGSFLTVIIYGFNGLVVSFKSLTPLITLSDSTDSLLSFHLSNLAGFIAVLCAGPTRIYTIYTIFFLIGLVFAFRRQQKLVLILFSFVLLNFVFLTTLVFQNALRYVQHIYPLFILLSIYGAVSTAESLGRRFEAASNSLLPLRSTALALTVLLLIANLEPERVLAAYGQALTPGNTHLAEYVRDHRESGDVVISTVPAVYAPITKLDYYLPHRLAPFDALYMREGRVIDRWAGGVLVNSLDQISHILEQKKRVWIHIHDRSIPNNVSLANLQSFVDTLGQPVVETFGARLRLWQPGDSLLPHVPNQGKDMGSY